MQETPIEFEHHLANLFEGKIPNNTDEFDETKNPSREEIEVMISQIRYLLESKAKFGLIFSYAHGDLQACTNIYARNYSNELAEVITECEPLMDRIKRVSIRQMLMGGLAR
jgi:hypothetical protein